MSRTRPSVTDQGFYRPAARLGLWLGGLALTTVLVACGGGHDGGSMAPVTQTAVAETSVGDAVAPAAQTTLGTAGTVAPSGVATPAGAAVPAVCAAAVAPALLTADQRAVAPWHLTRIQAASAWSVSAGRGVTVAVLDSGVDAQHPDLQGRLVAGWNLVDQNADTRDLYGHGTRVSGVIAAAVHNGVGVAGVAAAAQVMPVRVSDAQGNASIGRLMAGIIHAADHGARVINISFGDVAGNLFIQEAARYAKAKGALVVVAAGNEGRERALPKTDALLVVGGSTEADQRIPWSDYGPHVALVAPGEGIWTTVTGGGYKAVMGTSFSAPIVAGVAALMMAVNPAATPDQIMAWLQASADDIGVPGRDNQTGAGRVNAERAVRMAMNPGVFGNASASAAMASRLTPLPPVRLSC